MIIYPTPIEHEHEVKSAARKIKVLSDEEKLLSEGLSVERWGLVCGTIVFSI